MKRLILLLPILFQSCGLFGGIDYKPAIQANKAQVLVYNELSAAFTKVIMTSPGASAEQKISALADIQANRDDFIGFNGSLETFLIAAGDINPAEIIQLAKQAYDYVKAREKKDE